MSRWSNRRPPERIDAHGVRHRPGCESTTWAVTPAAGGVQIARCLGCGAVRLIPPKGGGRHG